jgi:hypothetical protein
LTLPMALPMVPRPLWLSPKATRRLSLSPML